MSKILVFLLTFIIYLLFTRTVLADTIVINEFLANPSGDEAQEEWVELYNSSDTQDVAGWTLCDASNHTLIISTDKTNGATTLLNSGQWLVVYRMGASFSLNNSDDETISLFDSSSCSGTPIDSVSYNGSSSDKSWGRIPDGTGELQEDLEKTPGAANQSNPTPTPTPTPTSSPSPSSNSSQTSTKSPSPTPKPSTKLTTAKPSSSPTASSSAVLGENISSEFLSSPSPTPSSFQSPPSKVASILIGSGTVLMALTVGFYLYHQKVLNSSEIRKEKERFEDQDREQA